jgi:hypothetical protein
MRALLLLALLTACAVPNDAGWETQPSHAPLPAYFIDTDGASLQKICGPRANFTFHGCAFRNYAAGKCFVYVESGAPEWLAAHENLHCAGFDHPQ